MDGTGDWRTERRERERREGRMEGSKDKGNGMRWEERWDRGGKGGHGQGGKEEKVWEKWREMGKKKG